MTGALQNTFQTEMAFLVNKAKELLKMNNKPLECICYHGFSKFSDR